MLLLLLMVVLVMTRGLVLIPQAAAAVRGGTRREVGLVRAAAPAVPAATTLACCCCFCCWFCQDPCAVINAAAGVAELEEGRPVALGVEVGEWRGRQQPPTQGKEEGGTHKVHPLHVAMLSARIE